MQLKQTESTVEAAVERWTGWFHSTHGRTPNGTERESFILGMLEATASASDALARVEALMSWQTS